MTPNQKLDAIKKLIGDPKPSTMHHDIEYVELVKEIQRIMENEK